MEVEIVKEEKDDIEFKIDNQTVAEVMRIYLNETDNVKFAAWRKEHPSKPLLMKVMTSSGSVKKAISEAADKIRKDADKVASLVKKK
ncbi:MAG: RpoL/Rpb11 RNA polymerase subunit family protein [Nanoarchaeota archaeon]